MMSRRIKENLSVVIMAAGKGTRMNSELPKVLHTLSGNTLLNHVIRTSHDLSPKNIVVIIGCESSLVKKSVKFNDILFSYQRQQHGTGHAVMQAKEHLEKFIGNTLVLSGDVPLIQKSTLISLLEKQEGENFDACMLTADLENPDGYGRVIRDSTSSNLKKVKEQRDCSGEELELKEINTGIYVFNNEKLFDLLPMLDNNNAQ